MKKSEPIPHFFYKTAPKPGTLRSIFKWGDPDRYKKPGKRLIKVLQDSLGLTDDDLQNPYCPGDSPILELPARRLSSRNIEFIESIVGKENISLDTVSRVKFSKGKSMEDILKLRSGIVEAPSDAAVHPRDGNDVKALIHYCNTESIPVHVYGGGSSVTLGLSCVRGGITLVMSTHMKRLIQFNEANQTITVEPGMMGPDYESILNKAPEKLGARHRYTGGHFPQSFEHSSVGGWVAALGSGQASSYYGDACDLVVSLEIITPAGTIKTLDYPSTATGPKINDIIKGSEGCFGVIISLTMKIFRYFPENTKAFSFMFPDFESTVIAARMISQGEFGMPSILRISDPEETDVALRHYGISDTVFDHLLRFRRLVPGKRCLLMGQSDGEKRFSKNVADRVGKICRLNDGVWLSAFPMKKWIHGRFSDAYLRDSLNDMGVLIDTLETSVTWDRLHHLHQAIRHHIKSHPPAICMTHASHFYAQGTNLYFIFIVPMKSHQSYRRFLESIITRILENGGSLSHHHGVGRLMGPFMEKHLGIEQMNVLRAVKSYFDPKGIMNPGGTLGFD